MLGVLYAFLFNVQPKAFIHNFDFALPSVSLPNFQDILTGFIILAIPQIPLSITNSVLATQKVAEDFFPRSKLSVKRISFTYSFMNLLNPFLGGVPVCHGSGGLVGHYTFGARTGGSLIIYGGLYLIIGLFFSHGFDKALQIFPLPALGIILVFEGFGLAKLIKQTSTNKELYIALVVGILAIGLKYGFLIGLILGTLLHYSVKKLNSVFEFEKKKGA
jgi:MFS superfamily sulfate permease-like transporter